MTIQTYTYDGGGQKRSENKNGTVTTIVWDGTDYLQVRGQRSEQDVAPALL